MASLVTDLVEAGIHFGHRSTNWNPKMAPYIYGKRNKIHVIDVKATIKGLLLARKYITNMVAEGKDVLFVGTKRQARHIIESNVRDVGMHYVTERWLGGTLTNFRTIRERLKRLEELEALEESGEINNYSKKMESQLSREKSKILRNLEGVRNMTKLPGCMVIIDVTHESNAVKEARKLGIPTVCLIDTDSNPELADIAIPGNDDAMRAIEVVVKSLCAAVAEGKRMRAASKQGAEQATAVAEGGEALEGGEGADDASGGPGKRRSSRAMYRAHEAEAGSPAEPSTDPTKMGAAEAEGDSDKAVTTPAGQNDTAAGDHAAPPQEATPSSVESESAAS